MPTYDYRCKDCAAELEVVQKFTDDALTVCPECNGNLRKVYSAVGVVFKGSGFYRTDSRAQDKQRASAGSGGAGSKPSGGDGSESKKSGEKSDSSSSGSNGSAGSNASGSAGSGSSTKPEKASSGSSAGPAAS